MLALTSVEKHSGSKTMHVLCFRFKKENNGIFILQNFISLSDIKNFDIDKPNWLVREFEAIPRENGGIKLVKTEETHCHLSHFSWK